MTQPPQKTLCLLTYSEKATIDLGRALGASLMGAAPSGVTVLLSGGLGMGKTTLVRGVGDALGATRVRSPSFTLVNEYRTESLPMAHADLFRLEPGDAEDLGLEEYHGSSGVLLVEWPERWINQPERDVLKVFIEGGSENERLFRISSLGGAADSVLQNLRKAVKDGKFDPGVGLQPALD